jgi:hypothetical protein
MSPVGEPGLITDVLADPVLTDGIVATWSISQTIEFDPECRTLCRTWIRSEVSPLNGVTGAALDILQMALLVSLDARKDVRLAWLRTIKGGDANYLTTLAAHYCAPNTPQRPL